MAHIIRVFAVLGALLAAAATAAFLIDRWLAHQVDDGSLAHVLRSSHAAAAAAAAAGRALTINIAPITTDTLRTRRIRLKSITSPPLLP